MLIGFSKLLFNHSLSVHVLIRSFFLKKELKLKMEENFYSILKVSIPIKKTKLGVLNIWMGWWCFKQWDIFFSNKIKKISIIHVLNSNWIIKHEFLLLSKQKNMYYAYIFSPLKNVLLTLYVMLCMMHNLNMLKCIKKYHHFFMKTTLC